MSKMNQRFAERLAKRKDERMVEQALMSPVTKLDNNFTRQLENFSQAIGGEFDAASGIVKKAYADCTMVVGVSSDGQDSFTDITFGMDNGAYVWSRTMKTYKPYASDLPKASPARAGSVQANERPIELFDSSYAITDGIRMVVSAYECGLNIPQSFIVGLNTFLSDFKKAMGKGGKSLY